MWPPAGCCLDGGLGLSPARRAQLMPKQKMPPSCNQDEGLASLYHLLLHTDICAPVTYGLRPDLQRLRFQQETPE